MNGYLNPFSGTPFAETLSGVTEIEIALGHPALTAEVRAWINNRRGARPVLSRVRRPDLAQGAVLLRVEVDADTEPEVQDEVQELMTDLRMLGLCPTLLPRSVV